MTAMPRPLRRFSRTPARVFAIVRKRLFDSLPSAERVDEVAQAYVAALQKAKRVDTIPTTPETFVERIRETYPFHPSIRDIVARFSENRGYQKTRALIRTPTRSSNPPCDATLPFVRPGSGCRARRWSPWRGSCGASAEEFLFDGQHSLREIAVELERAGHLNERGVRYSTASLQHMLAQRV